MSRVSVYVEDIIKDVVADVSTELGYTTVDPLTTKPLYYTYGPVSEILDKLIAMSKYEDARAPKYPMVALVMDVPHKGVSNSDIYAEVNLNIVIATVTRQEYISEDRLTNVFKTILMPIYEELLNQLVQDRRFNIQDDRIIPHAGPIRRYNWGRTNLFTDRDAGTDYIDAVEIQNMILQINQNNCITFKKEL